MQIGAEGSQLSRGRRGRRGRRTHGAHDAAFRLLAHAPIRNAASPAAVGVVRVLSVLDRVEGLSGANASALATSGGEAIALIGENLGDLGRLDRWGVGNRVALAAFAARDCVVLERETRVECLTGEGVGAGLLWEATIETLASTNGTVASSYRPPSLTAPPTVIATAVDAPKAQWRLTLRIKGRDFGPSEATGSSARSMARSPSSRRATLRSRRSPWRT